MIKYIVQINSTGFCAFLRLQSSEKPYYAGAKHKGFPTTKTEWLPLAFTLWNSFY